MAETNLDRLIEEVVGDRAAFEMHLGAFFGQPSPSYAVSGRRPDGLFDCIFADPPYFLSNGGISCQSGRVVSVHKGPWDRSSGFEADHAWNLDWFRRCRDLLRPDGDDLGDGDAPQHLLDRVRHATRVLILWHPICPRGFLVLYGALSEVTKCPGVEHARQRS